MHWQDHQDEGNLRSVVERLTGLAVFAVFDADPDESSGLRNQPHEKGDPGAFTA